MLISKRLEAVASAVCFETAADIGCDHGLTLIYLCKSNKIKKGIACDIGKLPLSKAEHNIVKYGYAGIMETRLADGLSALNPGEAETIIISGVGGMLLVKILSDGEAVVKAAKQLVLQPQLDACEVRKQVHKLGFKIENEEMIYEDGIYYNILNCKRGSEAAYNEIGYILGQRLIERRDPMLKRYIDDELEKLSAIAASLNGISTEAADARLKELNEQIRIYREIFLCL